MPETPAPPEAESEAPPQGLMGRVRAWVGGNRKRSLIVGGVLGLATLATMATWIGVAQLAAAPPPVTIEQALAALDDDEDDLAQSIVSEIRAREDLSPDEFNGALYVTGVLKSREAERQWSPDRARNDYLIASRYLAEGRTLGFPEGREAEGLFLLGKALIESRQLVKGVQTLEDALKAGAQGQAKAHLMLAEAHFYAPRPDYEETVKEVDLAREDPTLTPPRRAEAILLRAQALAALGRGQEAYESAVEARSDSDEGLQALVEAKAFVAQLETAPPDQHRRLGELAKASLTKARKVDKLATTITRQSDYLLARVQELLGQQDEALTGYDELWRRAGDSPAGIAATLAHADLLQLSGQAGAAIESYRRTVEAIEDPANYRSELAPLSEVRLRIRQAHARFLEQQAYPEALALADRSSRLLGKTEQLAMRADTLKRWGGDELAAAEARGEDMSTLARAARARLRDAGQAYERLAESRYGDESFDSDLWTAAMTLIEGQSYAGAIRVLHRYLRNEPVRRNALALLRLGECHLARGEDDLAIAAFDECLLFHEADAASFAARLGSASAHRSRGELEIAEELLRYNLTGTALTPESPEWRDSKFALGRLLAEAGRHDEAIREIDDAIKLYPDDPRSLMARYRIAIAHRAAAEEPLERFRQASTVVEREDAIQLAESHLLAALEEFKLVQDEIVDSGAADPLSRATLRNCYMLSGDIYFELQRYNEAVKAYSNISTLAQNEPFMLEALLHIYHCWRRVGDEAKSLAVVDLAQQTLERLPQDSDFATSTSLTREEWENLLNQLAAI